MYNFRSERVPIIIYVLPLTSYTEKVCECYTGQVLYRLFWTVFIFFSRVFYEAVTTATGMQLDDRRATPIRRTEVARRSNLSRVATVTAAFTCAANKNTVRRQLVRWERRYSRFLFRPLPRASCGKIWRMSVERRQKSLFFFRNKLERHSLERIPPPSANSPFNSVQSTPIQKQNS